MWTSSMMMGIGLPAIGGAYQGGYYIGDIDDGGTIYHLVLAPKASGQSAGLAYKTTANNDTGTDSTTNGLTNSNAINDASHPAAQFCRGLSIGGFSDWYLPAKDELAVVYTNRVSVVGADALDVDTTYYWSSTENPGSDVQAMAQRFSDGGQAAGTKTTTTLRTRAIRRAP